MNDCRTTRPAHWWQAVPHRPARVLGGRDEVALGSWLVAGENGRISFVTNVRNERALEPIPPGTPSRGSLPVEACVSQDVGSFLRNLQRKKHTYSPFNLLAADLLVSSDGKGRPKMWYLSNENEHMWLKTSDMETTGGVLPVQAGVHCVSNAALNTPWPKVEAAKKRFEKLIESQAFCSKEFPWEDVFTIMRDQTILEPTTGEEPTTKRELLELLKSKTSGIFVKPVEYQGRILGTRSITVIAVKRNTHEAILREQYLSADGTTWAEESYTFTMKKTNETFTA